MTKEISIQVRTDAFAKQFRWVDRFVENKTTIPILAHIRMAFDAASGVMELTGTDLENAGAALVQRQSLFGWESFQITVPSKPIVKMLAQAKGVDLLTLTYRDTVTMTTAASTDPDKKGEMVDVENHAYSLAISDGASTMTYEGLHADRFPELPAIETPLCRIGGDVAKFLRRTIHAVSRDDDNRFTLRGALMVLTPTGPDVLVATDGHRLSLQFIPTDYAGEETVRVLMNRDFLRHAIATLDDSQDGDLRLSSNDSHVKATFPWRWIIGRKLTGSFPDYGRVVPKEFASVISLDTKAFLKAANKFPILVKEQTNKPVAFTVHKGNVEEGDEPVRIALSAKSDAGTIEATCPCEMDPISDFKTGFNIDYVVEAASLMPDKFEWAFSQGNNPSELRAPEEGWRCVIMPVRI